MKLLLVIAMLCVTFGNAASLDSNPINEKEKNKKGDKKENVENNLISRNFHSIKRWKMTVEYTNGDIISKTIEIKDDLSFSAMELAFIEAEKYIKTLKKVKTYNVSPVSGNSFVLLAGGK
ncbi:hypothetical protein [uncultured Aquimarina sp.]|uniref:hypothetical protein n=1 Tax=uncultured Aquimarina sp. TaxID=575652 RepID=UPI002603BA81|nr:hypothetical protein [uncultured Aquimarina sp.]